MGSANTYIILELFLFFLFIFCGYGISKGEKNTFWLFGWIAIIPYSLIKGLRYDRGVDYVWYMYQYEHPGEIDQDIGFTIINQTLNSLGVPYYGAFVFYSFVLILSVIILLKHFRELAIYVLPVFLVITTPQSDNLIRQYFGFSFVFLSFLFLMKDQLWKCLAFMVISALVHSSSLMLFPFFLVFYYVKIPVRSPYLFLILYLLVFLFWKVEYWGDYAALLDGLDVGVGNFNRYTENAEHWFTDESSLGDGKAYSTILLFRKLLSQIILIYFGTKLLDSIRGFQVPFFLFYISVIILQMAGDIEIIRRIGVSFKIFEMYVAGVVLYYTKQCNLFTKGAMWFLIINYVYDFIAKLLYSSNLGDYLFIWDIN